MSEDRMLKRRDFLGFLSGLGALCALPLPLVLPKLRRFKEHHPLDRSFHTVVDGCVDLDCIDLTLLAESLNCANSEAMCLRKDGVNYKCPPGTVIIRQYRWDRMPQMLLSSSRFEVMVLLWVDHEGVQPRFWDVADGRFKQLKAYPEVDLSQLLNVIKEV